MEEDKKRNQKKMQAIDGDEDRISSLPDSILHEILSSTDVKSAVQTCALSKRWRYVWTSLPNLRFDFDRFPFPKTASADTKRLRFTHFVNQLLSLRDNSSNVCCFYFSPNYCDDPSFIEKSLCYALCHNVQQLHVSAFSYPTPFEFPRCFINSESLKALTLVYGYYSIPLDISLRLPALKTLHLTGFHDRYANFITETVGNCPNLETLILDYLSVRRFNINAPQLRKLELCYHRDEHYVTELETFGLEIVVSAPRLTSFKLEGNVSPVFSAASLPCLDDVYVDLWFSFDPIIEPRMSLNAINMLGQLREANSVTLSLATLEVLAMATNSLKKHPSPFHKLKHLKVIAEDLIQDVMHPTLTLPLNVITYLTRGSSCGDTLVLKFLGQPWITNRTFLGNFVRSPQ